MTALVTLAEAADELRLSLERRPWLGLWLWIRLWITRLDRPLTRE